MARRSGLGRGLGALIPNEALDDDDAVLRDLAVSQIEPNVHQPRSHFDEESLASLTASIRELGVLQPVLVRPLDGGRFELVAGERRWRAAKRAGLPSIPAIVRPTEGSAALEQALVENIHREDLNALEEAAAYQQLIEDFGLTHDELAQRVGRSRSAVSNALRLFQLPPSIQRLLAERQLSAGHARALLGTPDRAFQEALARRTVAEDLAVREVEEAVRARAAPGADGGGQGDPGDEPEAGTGKVPRRSGTGGARPPGLLELEELLSNRLDTRVQVTMTAKKGRISIEFATLEDLERIYRAMIEPPAEG